MAKIVTGKDQIDEVRRKLTSAEFCLMESPPDFDGAKKALAEAEQALIELDKAIKHEETQQ